MSLIVPDKNGAIINQNNLCANNTSNTKRNNEELINECKKLFDKIDNLCNSGAAVVVPPASLSSPHQPPLPSSSSSSLLNPSANVSSPSNVNIVHATTPTSSSTATETEAGGTDNATSITGKSMEFAKLESDDTNTERTNINSITNVEYNKSDERQVQISMTPATGTSAVIVPELNNLCSSSRAGIQFDGSFSDDELRLLICELKRKVEYIENMNWLCKYLFFFFFSF